MVILADAQREIGSLKNANVEFDVNDKKMFTLQIARCYWTQSLTFDALVYVPDTEYGGIIGSDYKQLPGGVWGEKVYVQQVTQPVKRNFTFCCTRR